MKFLLKFSFLFLFIFSISQSLNAQINIKVGYTLGFLQSKVTDDILEEFNTRNDWLGTDGEFGNWRSIHGLSMGLLYRSRFFGVELSYNNKLNKIEARGNDPLLNSNFQGDIQFKLNSLSAAYELYIGETLGVGASLDWSTFKVSYEVNNNNNDQQLIRQNGLTSHFYGIINLSGNETISLAIKPFVQIPWVDWDFTNLDRALNPNGSSITNHKERFLNFGFSIIFYNGRNNYTF
jgi:hypothetical protein